MYIGDRRGITLFAQGATYYAVRAPLEVGADTIEAEVVVRNCAIGQAQCKVAGPGIDGPTQSPIMLARQGRRHRLVMRVLARVSGTPEGSSIPTGECDRPGFACGRVEHRPAL